MKKNNIKVDLDYKKQDYNYFDLAEVTRPKSLNDWESDVMRADLDHIDGFDKTLAMIEHFIEKGYQLDMIKTLTGDMRKWLDLVITIQGNAETAKEETIKAQIDALTKDGVIKNKIDYDQYKRVTLAQVDKAMNKKG